MINLQQQFRVIVPNTQKTSGAGGARPTLMCMIKESYNVVTCMLILTLLSWCSMQDSIKSLAGDNQPKINEPNALDYTCFKIV